MDKSRKNKHAFTVKLLAFVVIACAWLIPACVALSAQPSGDIKVSLSVTNSVGVDIGWSAMDVSSESKVNKGITKIISKKIAQAVTSPAPSKFFTAELRYPQSDVVITVIDL